MADALNSTEQAEPESFATSRPERPRSAWLLWALGSAYVVAAALAKASITLPGDDLNVFWVPTAQLILDGRPEALYSLRYPIFGAEFPNAYPPLFFFLLAPFVALADALGLAYEGTSAFGASLVGLPLLAGDVAAAMVLCHAARGRMREGERAWLLLLVLVQPPLWFSSVRMQHHESMILAALLGSALAVERGRAGWCVGLAALALGLKATAVLALPALALGLHRAGRRRAALAVLLLPPLAVGALLAPWLGWRWEDTSYSLLRFEALHRPIFGISAAKLVAGTALETAVARGANPAILVLAALVPAWRLRRGGALRQSLAAVFLLALLLSRWVYPHYLVVPLGLLAFWELERESFPRLSLLAVGAGWALQSPYFREVTLEATAGVRLRSALWTLALLGLVAAVLRDRGARTRPGAEAQTATHNAQCLS